MKASKRIWVPVHGHGGKKGKTPTKKLDASAKEWDPVNGRAPVEDRTLYLTFSDGLPLEEYQIIRFFNYTFGHCVERVYVHWPIPTSIYHPALFGKVVFKVSYIPAIILGGKNEARFIVDGRPLWCKKYDPIRRHTVPQDDIINMNNVQNY